MQSEINSYYLYMYHKNNDNYVALIGKNIEILYKLEMNTFDNDYCLNLSIFVCISFLTIYLNQ